MTAQRNVMRELRPGSTICADAVRHKLPDGVGYNRQRAWMRPHIFTSTNRRTESADNFVQRAGMKMYSVICGGELRFSLKAKRFMRRPVWSNTSAKPWPRPATSSAFAPLWKT
jgi:hypothetical protein